MPHITRVAGINFALGFGINLKSYLPDQLKAPFIFNTDIQELKKEPVGWLTPDGKSGPWLLQIDAIDPFVPDIKVKGQKLDPV